MYKTHFGFEDGLLSVVGDSSLFYHMLEIETGHVDVPARRSVVHTINIAGDFVAANGGGEFVRLDLQQIFSYHDHSEAGGSAILLGACVNQSVSRPVDFSGAEIAAHV